MEAVNQDTAVQFQRDKLGRVLSETQGAGVPGLEQTVTSDFDKAGNRIGVKSSLGADIKFERNKLGAVTGIKAQQGEAKTWQAQIQRNLLGLEVARKMTGGVSSQWHYDVSGRPVGHQVTSGKRTVRHRTYKWSANDRLHSMINQLTNGQVSYGHDAFGNLAWAKYEDGSYDYKLPDEVGNLYKSKTRSDRTYGPGGRLLKDDKFAYTYDGEGNLIKKASRSLDGNTTYEWYGNGMLKKVIDGKGASTFFEYDALGRRTAKIHSKKITRFVWDGNVPLHEWVYEDKDKPQPVVGDPDSYTGGGAKYETPEPMDKEKLVTWVFEDGSFAPSAKLVGKQRYSIVSDYIGKPVQAYDDNGDVVWEVAYDIYGGIRKQVKGAKHFVPFRNQGQYEDRETGLFYNRFRYYDSGIGNYISQDPIGLSGNNPNVYAYTLDSNTLIDIFGLSIFNPISWTAPSSGTGITYKIFQREIDWDLPSNGKGGITDTNLDRALRGDSPFVVKDGNYELINLHHSNQNANGPIFELSEKTHITYGNKNALHPHKVSGVGKHPHYPVNHNIFKKDKKAYWKHRGNQELEARKSKVNCK